MAIPNCVVLTGPMAVGKTTVGHLLAGSLGRTLIDSDRVIEALEGRSGREIAASVGVVTLHRMEERVVREAMRSREPVVVAAAASIADRTALLAAIGEPRSVLVYLHASQEYLDSRLESETHRRSLSRTAARRLAAHRLRNAQQSGAVVVDTTGLGPVEVADRVRESITR